MITIIVLLILAGVTLSMVIGESGLFEKANKAKEQTQISTAKEIIRMQVLENEAYKSTNDPKAKSDEELLQSIEDKLTEEGFKIENGKIKIGSTEIDIAEEIANASSGAIDRTKGKNDDSKNRTLAGTTTGYSYKNPVIPHGFKAIDTNTAKWTYTDKAQTEVTGWNEGLVIRDTIGNEFVWVPVDGTNVKYEKWCTIGLNNQITYLSCSDDIEAIPVTENAQIDTYQDLSYSENGKYFKRTNSEADASWSEGIFIRTGNSDNSSYPFYYHASGLNANGIKKNIADLGGNVWEWTAEIYSTNRVHRGGGAYHNVADCPASYRNINSTGRINFNLGFRVVLYIN